MIISFGNCENWAKWLAGELMNDFEKDIDEDILSWLSVTKNTGLGDKL